MHIARMKRSFFRNLSLVALLTAPAFADEPLVWVNPVVAFHDGDSGTILDIKTGTIEKFRIDGYDTPEISTGHSKCVRERRHGILAAARASAFVLSGPIEAEWTDEDKDGQIDRGRYDRGLVQFWATNRSGERERSLYDHMVAPQFALPYEGGTRPDWCRFLELLLKERLKEIKPTN